MGYLLADIKPLFRKSPQKNVHWTKTDKSFDKGQIFISEDTGDIC